MARRKSMSRGATSRRDSIVSEIVSSRFAIPPAGSTVADATSNSRWRRWEGPRPEVAGRIRQELSTLVRLIEDIVGCIRHQCDLAVDRLVTARSWSDAARGVDPLNERSLRER